MEYAGLLKTVKAIPRAAAEPRSALMTCEVRALPTGREALRSYSVQATSQSGYAISKMEATFGCVRAVERTAAAHSTWNSVRTRYRFRKERTNSVEWICMIILTIF